MSFWLQPLAWAYGGITAARRRARRRRPPLRLPVPVISVGNLTVGGTGKTEAAAFLCRLLLARGRRPAVLSRGYRRRGSAAVVVVSRGQGPEVPVAAAGDEPFLLALRLPRAAVVVSADRFRAGRLAVRELGSDVLVLDDGFQRRDDLHHDLDVVLVDAGDPFGGGRLLPAGRLREPLSALADAGLLIITRADQHAVTPVRKELARRAPGVPVLTARHRPVALRPLNGGPDQGIERLAGLRVFAVSGLARPDAFEASLERLGAHLAGRLRFADHHWYTAADRRRIAAQAAAARAEVVTTAKDAVRLEWPGGLPAWSLQIELEVLSPAHELENRLDRVLRV